MGFFLNGEPRSGYKQHLNLSHLAWAVIDTDMQRFYGTCKAPLSTFLNHVFSHFYADSKATISIQMIPVVEQLDFIFSFPEVKTWVNHPIKTKIYDTVLSLRADDFLMAVTDFPKGEGRKFRVNKANRALLEELNDDRYYNNNVGAYLKAVFEDFARKPYHERETVFFHDQVTLIREAIDKKYRLKISTTDGHKYWACPYSLCLDKYSAFNYLVGFMEEIIEGDGAAAVMEPQGLRLSHIDQVKIVHHPSGRINETQRTQMEHLLNEYGPNFSFGSKREILVRLDHEGFTYWEAHASLGPKMLRCLDPDHWVFYGTESEVRDFFSAFGTHAQVFSNMPHTQ